MRHESQVRFLAFSPDGKTILTACLGKEARLWDTATGQLMGVLAHQGQISATAFSPDGKTILTGSLDGTVRLFDANQGQPVGRVLEIPSTDGTSQLSPNGKVLISSPREPNYQRYVQLWDAMTRRPIARLAQPGGNATGFFSSDGKVLLTIEGDQTARVWDATTGAALGPAWPIPSQFDAVRLSHDGKTVLFEGKDDQTVWICDGVTGSVRGPTLHVDGYVYGFDLSPDGTTFVTGGVDGEVRLWDAATLTPLGDPLRHPSCITYGKFSHDGKSLVIGCEDGGLWLWDVATRKPLMPPLRHQGPIAADSSPDGKTILTHTQDKTFRLRDFATGQPIGPILGHFVGGMRFLADGKTLSTTDSGVPRLLPIPPDLPDELERVATWVEVMTGLRLDKQEGLIQVLDIAAWLERRERLMQLGGPPETGPDPRLDPILFGPDPIARARRFMERKQWDAAEAAFDEARSARPFNISIVMERGDLYAHRGLWSEAAAYYATTVKQYPEVAPLHQRLAVTRLLAGDLPGYRTACVQMLEHFKPIDDSTAVLRLAYTCSLAPEAVADLPGLIEVSERSTRWAEAITKLPGRIGDPERFTRWLASNRRALGAALFRAGRLEEARRRFEQSYTGFQPQAWDFLLLAMIHSGLGHDDESRRLLDRADQWIAAADKAPVGTENDVPRWSSLFEKPVVLLLRREAGSLINASSSFPADPFAPCDAARTSSAPARPMSG
jgi:WD40 repeat protein/tetratricopeptide (TPR) repeat protein